MGRRAEEKPWACFDLWGVVAVALKKEAHLHDLGSESCRCGPTVSTEFSRPLILHRALEFSGVSVPDAGPSEGIVA